MAKPLTKPPPTSSVANMLQPGLGAHVIAKPSVATPEMPPTPVQTPTASNTANHDEPRLSGEVPSISRQFGLTPNTDRVLKNLVAMYSDSTGMELKHSELLRAILVACEHSMPELTREAQLIGPLRRPKNDRGREAEREEIERKISAAFVAGMRTAGIMR